MGLLHCVCVPVRPVDPVLKQGDGKDVREGPCYGPVSVLAIHVCEAGQRWKWDVDMIVNDSKCWICTVSNSLQVAEVSIGKEDPVVAVVYGQGSGPVHLGSDDSAGVSSVHASPANVRHVTPMGPVQPAGKQR